ncbi:MAG TPA: VOC family protein [Thermoleophilaceae bacterium]|nr:VOC family protein [Thermoleophilaceae bacterium]
MGERTSHAPGTFSWADVTTTDQDGAKAFYSGLFGWEANDLPVGDGVHYSMMLLGGREVAAISPQPQQQREAGVPPMWNSYVTVESADAAAERAGQLGATVHAPPFDVMEAGRMAVIQDPQGAFFMVWEPRESIGARFVTAPGALAWNELASPDVDGSIRFYGDLFGWSTQAFENSPERYEVIMNGDRSNGGMHELREGQGPPNWLAYFGIDDIDRGIARAEELGGSKLIGPVDIGMAKIAVLRDPQGATFAIYAGQFQD